MRFLLTAILACSVGTAGAATFGAAGAATTTTTVPDGTTSTTVAGSSTTTTTFAGSTTTTTTMPDDCGDDGDFGSTLCRLDVLIAQTDASDDLDGQQTKLANAAAKARMLINRAREKCDGGGAQADKKSGRDLRKASRRLIGYRRGLTSNRARKQLDDEARRTFLAMIEPLIDDVKALRRAGCQPDGSPSGAFLPTR